MVGPMLAKMAANETADAVDPEGRKMLDLIGQKVKFILDEMESSPEQVVPKREMTELIFLFNSFFDRKRKQEEREKYRSLGTEAAEASNRNDDGDSGEGEGEDKVQATQNQPRAPFCDPGEDCFEDVDHQSVSMDIKRLALTLSGYLKDRMKKEQGQGVNDLEAGGENAPELETNIQFRTDAMLTQTTAMLARLHRAVLMNTHQINMLTQNMAGNSQEDSTINRNSDAGEGRSSAFS